MPTQLFNLSRPICSLVTIWALWKSLLLLMAVASPGPGYDTSTSLLLLHNATRPTESSSKIVHFVTGKLNRWDAIYFVKLAERGYLLEQEWAFGWGWTGLIGLVTAGLRQVGIVPHDGDLRSQSLVGIAIAHVSHVLSVLVLYQLSNSISLASSATPRAARKFAFVAACLHIFSPAGLFLSAPYAESTFALLSFSGYFLFHYAAVATTSSNVCKRDASLVLAGLCFGLSNTIRSNGLLNGMIFPEEAVRALLSFRVQRLLAAGLGGALVGLGFLLPQAIAYQHFCVNTGDVGASREWCTRSVPSIYTFVQAHYWNSGLFQYWTIPNIPLFLLATPMLSLISLSSIWAFKTPLQPPASKSGKTKQKRSASNSATTRVLKTIAVIQAILGAMTFLTAHVQIITRIASGYPVWYWYIASKTTTTTQTKAGSSSSSSSKWTIRWMIMYAIIQGSLFASFLPPA